MRLLKTAVFRFVDVIGAPVTLMVALSGLFLRRAGMHRMPISRRILLGVGVLPVRDHYYEPMINPQKHLRRSLRDNRTIEGLDYNMKGQIALIESFRCNAEILDIRHGRVKTHGFDFANAAFKSGDAEFLYQMVRTLKPRTLIEIGSGHSTRVVRLAGEKNRSDDPNYTLKHICIEPYEQHWLEGFGVETIRQRVELLPAEYFDQLSKNDILFIDSSHVIRPQGDVLHELLEVVGRLKPGVCIHFHDIFTPKDYPDETIAQEIRFWNEQYILEAFLCFNDSFEVIGSLNYLWHQHRSILASCCPVLAKETGREPGSFWIRRVER